MSREQMAFLFGGLAFGILIGFGSYHVVHTMPRLDEPPPAAAEIPGPRGPQAPTQLGPNAEGGAPMVARINELKRRLQESPEDGAVLLELANIYYDAAMWDRAADYYERAVAAVGEEPDALTDLGVCYRGMGRFDEAIGMFDRANAADPKHWQSLYNKIVVAVFDLDRVDLAVEALESMEAIDPRPAELAQGRLEQLRQILERAGREGAAGEPS
jgi:tetratricopeptide (TPR) repeat protein